MSTTAEEWKKIWRELTKTAPKHFDPPCPFGDTPEDKKTWKEFQDDLKQDFPNSLPRIYENSWHLEPDPQLEHDQGINL
jgi:hypothetical protein